MGDRRARQRGSVGHHWQYARRRANLRALRGGSQRRQEDEALHQVPSSLASDPPLSRRLALCCPLPRRSCAVLTFPRAFACAAALAASCRYCSRECQRAAWGEHKRHCVDPRWSLGAAERAAFERMQGKVESKYALENYACSLRNSINDEKFRDKIEEEDRATIEGKITETTEWLDNQMAEKEEFDAKQKELEAVANPIMQKIYAAAGGGAPGGMPDMGGAGAPDMGGAGGDAGPTIDEVD